MGKDIWLEVLLPAETSQETINMLISHNFNKSSDGFYIPEALLELFSILAFPYPVTILQRYVHEDIPLEVRRALITDMARKLTEAGVEGIDTWLNKFDESERPEYPLFNSP